MKNQYFGDVNDYRKYGLLRTLLRESGLRLGVCWMLTPDDGGADGKFIDYLRDPKRWRRYDSDLFDDLTEAVPQSRSLSHIAARRLLPNALLYDGVIPDKLHARTAVMARAIESLAEAELLFFDPDNGMEVKSCKPGNKESSKYLAWNEATTAYQSGKSLIIYQHFRRVERKSFVAGMASEFKTRLNDCQVIALCTANVVFFLVVQPSHAEKIDRAVEKVAATWETQITAIRDPQLVDDAQLARLEDAQTGIVI